MTKYIVSNDVQERIYQMIDEELKKHPDAIIHRQRFFHEILTFYIRNDCLPEKLNLVKDTN